MQYGRVVEVNESALSFPQDDGGNSDRILHSVSLKQKSEPELFYGAPVWSNKDWVGNFYPPRIQNSELLRYYSSQVPAIELNSTFYAVPNDEQIQSWIKSLPENFRFCPKYPQLISHRRELAQMKEHFEVFEDALRCFGSHLGLPFIQLAETFSSDDCAYLENLLSLRNLEIPAAIEFRHPSWFNNNSLTANALALMKEYRLSSVITDTLGKRHSLHSSLSNDKLLIRFAGHNMHPCDEWRLEMWASRLKKFVDSGVKEIYFFIHSPDESYIPELLYVFTDMINKHRPLIGAPRLKPWRTYEVDESVQATLF